MSRLFKSQRIRKSSDFAKFRASGVESARTELIILKKLTRKKDNAIGNNKPRIGIITSKKVGNACIRNRIRRLIREAFRLHQHNFDRAGDYLFLSLPAIRKVSNKEIIEKLEHIIQQLELLS